MGQLFNSRPLVRSVREVTWNAIQNKDDMPGFVNSKSERSIIRKNLEIVN